MNSHHTIVDLATVAVVLPTDAHSMLATLGRARLVHATDRLGMGMILDNDLLAAISECFFIPLDRFEESLPRPRRRLELQSDRFGRDGKFLDALQERGPLSVSLMRYGCHDCLRNTGE